MEKIYKALCAIACSITLHTTAMEQKTQNVESPSVSPCFHYSGSFCMGFVGYDLISIMKLQRALRESEIFPSHSLYTFQSLRNAHHQFREMQQILRKTKMRAGFVGLLGAGLLSVEPLVNRMNKTRD